MLSLVEGTKQLFALIVYFCFSSSGKKWTGNLFACQMEKFEERLSKQAKTYFQEFSERELQLIKNPVFSDLDFHEEDSQLVGSLEN